MCTQSNLFIVLHNNFDSTTMYSAGINLICYLTIRWKISNCSRDKIVLHPFLMLFIHTKLYEDNKWINSGQIAAPLQTLYFLHSINLNMYFLPQSVLLLFQFNRFACLFSLSFSLMWLNCFETRSVRLNDDPQ